MSSDEGGLRRWARRKAEVKQGRGAAAPVIEDNDGKAPTLSEPEGLTDGNEGAVENQPVDPPLPDIESLTAESDFTGFMKEGVSPALRRLALRQLWASDPAFNVIDEMVEYGGDYTQAALMVEGMKSAWVAGRGYAKEEPPADEALAEDAELVEGDRAGKALVDETDRVAEGGEDPDEDTAAATEKNDETDLG
ncbi:MAG: DUF3306 domain-containing protein [Alphaproteobacteria bacterium]|nr:DUF3306 domain-containing protein [Alphaproteobacteria bacterium]